MNFCKIFFLVVILNSILSAQNTNISPSNYSSQDSVNTENFHLPKAGFKYDLTQNSLFSDRIKFNLDLMNYSYNNSYFFQNNDLQTQSLTNDFIRYNKNLKNALKLVPGFQRKKDLGVFGEILGYTNAAATLGLLIYHLHKYKDKY